MPTTSVTPGSIALRIHLSLIPYGEFPERRWLPKRQKTNATENPSAGSGASPALTDTGCLKSTRQPQMLWDLDQTERGDRHGLADLMVTRVDDDRDGLAFWISQTPHACTSGGLIGH